VERLNFEANMIVRVQICGKCDPTYSKVDPNAHLALQKNVTAMARSGRFVFMGGHEKHQYHNASG
jgi:hypothetical protein